MSATVGCRTAALLTAVCAMCAVSGAGLAQPTTNTACSVPVMYGGEQMTAEKYESGSSWSVVMDQDWFQLDKIARHTDRNYTMGFGLSRAGSVVRNQGHDVLLRLTEAALERLVPVPERTVGTARRKLWSSLRYEDCGQSQAFVEMLHGTAFTPDSIEDPSPIGDDRPYAFLLGWTVRRVTSTNGGKAAWTSELTVGHVGSTLGRDVQRGIHRAIHKNPPEGWENQIHNTGVSILGVPVARYGLSYERQLGAVTWQRIGHAILGHDCDGECAAKPGRRAMEVTVEGGGEIGYYTTASIGTRLRLGSFASPFWTARQNPLGGVGARGVSKHTLPIDFFAFAGGRSRLVGYNLLLSGYGTSAGPVRVEQRRVRRLVHEWEAGVAAEWEYRRHRSVQLSWVVDAGRSPEFKGPLARSHHWGGFYLTARRNWQ